QGDPFCHLRFLLVSRTFIDELAMNVASVEVRGSDRHDGCRNEGANPDCSKSDTDEPRGEAVKNEGRHGEVIAKLFKAGCEFRKFVQPGGKGKKTNQGQQSEQKSIARQQCSLTPRRVVRAR